MKNKTNVEEKKYGHSEVELMTDPKNWEVWDAPKYIEVIYQTFPEFTCLCPRSGYPDFAKVHLIMIPGEKVLELKCLKLWLNSFRNTGISHENMTQKIADTLFNELKLRYIFVVMEYTPRGNLTTFPMTERDLANFSNIDVVKIIKKKLLNKII
jgi:7-cyano-7-deazaguanine reductase